mmetsp:Transcript_28426/g.68321  ORF Transcript_28426/g.68321 Transcript_28426/m.68321 type:complete len:245 (-) Transcript_28426:198-932(-)
MLDWRTLPHAPTGTLRCSTLGRPVGSTAIHFDNLNHDLLCRTPESSSDAACQPLIHVCRFLLQHIVILLRGNQIQTKCIGMHVHHVQQIIQDRARVVDNISPSQCLFGDIFRTSLDVHRAAQSQLLTALQHRRTSPADASPGALDCPEGTQGSRGDQSVPMEHQSLQTHRGSVVNPQCHLVRIVEELPEQKTDLWRCASLAETLTSSACPVDGLCRRESSENESSPPWGAVMADFALNNVEQPP